MYSNTVIWYHLYYLKNVRNTHGRVLLLWMSIASACNFITSDTHPEVFLTFFELCKWYQIGQGITLFKVIFEVRLTF